MASPDNNGDEVNEGKKPKKILKALSQKVNALRNRVKTFRDSTSPSKAPVARRAPSTSLERALMLRIQKWGKNHNLPEWAQQKMAHSLIKEDERRKKRSELQAKKDQLLRQATLKHAIVVGAKSAEEERKRAEEAKKIMPDMRKGDVALPYKLESLNLDSLVTASSISTAGPAGVKKANESPKTTTTPTQTPPKVDKAKLQKEQQESMLAALYNTGTTKTDKDKPRFEVTDDEASILAYLDHLDLHEQWEQESNENSLFNWIMSQTSPDDLNSEEPPNRDYDISFDPIVVGKTYPYRRRTYHRDEPFEEYETDLLD